MGLVITDRSVWFVLVDFCVVLVQLNGYIQVFVSVVSLYVVIRYFIYLYVVKSGKSQLLVTTTYICICLVKQYDYLYVLSLDRVTVVLD